MGVPFYFASPSLSQGTTFLKRLYSLQQDTDAHLTFGLKYLHGRSFIPLALLVYLPLSTLFFN